MGTLLEEVLFSLFGPALLVFLLVPLVVYLTVLLLFIAIASYRAYKGK